MLLKAAEIVRAGWCQYAAKDDAGNVCMLGAVGRALGFEPPGELVHPATSRNETYLLIKSKLPSGLAFWNDAPGRTAEEVAAVLEHAAFADMDPRGNG